MTDDIPIPPEAVEAAARAYAIANEGHDKWWTLHMRKSSAAIRAAIAAWPGAETFLTAYDLPILTLPLPQEKTDAEA